MLELTDEEGEDVLLVGRGKVDERQEEGGEAARGEGRKDGVSKRS